MDGLREIAPELWILEEPLRFRRVEIGRRMVVARLRQSELWVHSPARLTGDLSQALEKLGQVRYVVAASKWHGHSYMEQYRRAFPDAMLLAAPGLAGHRRELAFDALLGDGARSEWDGAIDQATFLGNVFADEIVFLHRSSRTLILGDLCFNIGKDAPLSARALAWGLPLRPRFGPTPMFRASVRNRGAARRSLERILAWDFDRVLPGHGEIIESGGRLALERAFGWLAPRRLP